jgi:hypothetical protein
MEDDDGAAPHGIGDTGRQDLLLDDGGGAGRLDLLLDVGAALRRPGRSTNDGERHPIDDVL